MLHLAPNHLDKTFSVLLYETFRDLANCSLVPLNLYIVVLDLPIIDGRVCHEYIHLIRT